MTVWRIAAYCPKGHTNMIGLKVTDDSMLIQATQECETCEQLQFSPSKLSRTERREIRRTARALKKWDGRL